LSARAGTDLPAGALPIGFARSVLRKRSIVITAANFQMIAGIALM